MGFSWNVQRSMELNTNEAKLTDLSKLRVIELQDGYQALILKVEPSPSLIVATWD